MENLAPPVSTWLPTKRARIDVTDGGDVVTIRAEGAGELRSRLLRDPSGTAFTLRGSGFVSDLGLEEANLEPSATQSAERPCAEPTFRSPPGSLPARTSP